MRQDGLSPVDANGVVIAFIQALYRLMPEKDRQDQELGRKVEQLQARLARIERSVRRGRAAKSR